MLQTELPEQYKTNIKNGKDIRKGETANGVETKDNH
jgi:hypothetical protein